VALPANDGEMFYFKLNTVITIDCVKRMKKKKGKQVLGKIHNEQKWKTLPFFFFFGSLAMN
jgi:hypothetical protein